MTVAHIAEQKNFHHFTLYKTKQNGGWEYDFTGLTAFFTNRGYFITRTSKTKFILIRIIDNIVVEVGKKELKDEILNFLINVDECPQHIHQFALKDIAKAVNDEFLETLPEKHIDFRRDKKDSIYLYYQNGIVKVDCMEISVHKYETLNGYIWESQILQRDFIEGDRDESDFKKFIFNISNQDSERFYSLCSMIGFLIHNYKNPAYCPAIILNDEVISDNPEGGTGKGILINAIQQFMKTTVIEGKTFNFDKNFVYQDVNTDTKIIAFQDVNKSFDFERLFSVLTDGINVEKKGMQSVHFDFEDSPKIIISTNRAIRGAGNSHKRRRFEVEISQYYNGSRSPLDEFKKMFFKEWSTDEFSDFDTFMAECCQYYLRTGLKEQAFINLPEKQLQAETNGDFLEFMEDRQLVSIAKADFYGEFIRAYPEMIKNRYFSKQMLTKWLKIYALYKGYKVPDKDLIRDSVRYYTFERLQS